MPGYRQNALVELLRPGPCLTTAEMATELGWKRDDVNVACRGLVTKGWIDRLQRGCYVLSPAGRAAADHGETIEAVDDPRSARRPLRPARRTVRDRLWSAIRISRKFDLARLEELAGANRPIASAFVVRLARVGIVSELKRSPATSGTCGTKRWLLLNDLGPMTPVLKQDGRVWDPNTRTFVSLESGGDA